mgnify:CR=1 FL=1
MNKNKKRDIIIFGFLWFATAILSGIFPTLRETLLVAGGVFMGYAGCIYFHVPYNNILEYEVSLDGVTCKAKVTGIDKENADAIMEVIKLNKGI